MVEQESEDSVPIKMSFGQRMAEARRLRKEGLEKVLAQNNDSNILSSREALKPINDETTRDELYHRLKQEKKKNSTGKAQRDELRKIIGGQTSGKDPLDILDYDSNQLNGFERALTGWGAGTIYFIRTLGPLIIFVGAIYYVWTSYKTWILQNIWNIFNGVAYLGLFVGVGNILYDVLQKSGKLKPSIKFLSNKPSEILTFKGDEKKGDES